MSHAAHDGQAVAPREGQAGTPGAAYSGPQPSPQRVLQAGQGADVAQHRPGQNAPDGGVRDPAGGRQRTMPDPGLGHASPSAKSSPAPDYPATPGYGPHH
jgi:hypothetical protein